MKIAIAILASVGALLIALLVVGAVFLLRPSPPRVPTIIAIADVTQPTNVLLSGGNYGAQLSVRLRGEIDGHASVFVLSPKSPQINPLLSNYFSGSIDWARGSDWFETNAVFLYKPEGVTTGSL